MTLFFERLPAGSALPPGHHLLGERMLTPEGGSPALPTLLQPSHPVLERWLSERPVREVRSGLLSCRFDGQWLHGQAELPMPGRGAELQRATRQLYLDLFQVLHEHGGLHLLKLWNYLPGINAELDGLEVYRHFNIGRQEAFLEAGAAAFEGAPAACALGHQGAAISVSFLAGRMAPRAVENPRQVSAYHYPSDYGPRSPTFSRAARAELSPGTETLLISGTASIVGHTTVHPGDVVRQTEETLRNLQAVVESAQGGTPARFDLARMQHTVYVRHPSDLPRVREVFEQALGPDSPAVRSALWLQADVCRSDLLLEIEAQGCAL